MSNARVKLKWSDDMSKLKDKFTKLGGYDKKKLQRLSKTKVGKIISTADIQISPYESKVLNLHFESYLEDYSDNIELCYTVVGDMLSSTDRGISVLSDLHTAGVEELFLTKSEFSEWKQFIIEIELLSEEDSSE